MEAARRRLDRDDDLPRRRARGAALQRDGRRQGDARRVGALPRLGSRPEEHPRERDLGRPGAHARRALDRGLPDDGGDRRGARAAPPARSTPTTSARPPPTCSRTTRRTSPGRRSTSTPATTRWGCSYGGRAPLAARLPASSSSARISGDPRNRRPPTRPFPGRGARSLGRPRTRELPALPGRPRRRSSRYPGQQEPLAETIVQARRTRLPYGDVTSTRRPRSARTTSIPTRCQPAPPTVAETGPVTRRSAAGGGRR